MSSAEQEARVTYCKEHNVHHLFELLATKVLVDRPENPFAYLRDLLVSVEESEKKKGTYDPTEIRFATDANGETDAAAAAAAGGGKSNGEANGGGGEGAAGAVATSANGGATGASGKGKRKRITLGTFGLDNAGKTTLLSALGGNVDVDCTPTVGFSPIQFAAEEYDICIFDLGGAANFRGIWVHYFHDCHGLIFVIDSAADDARVAEALKVLQETAGHEYMRGKPVLVLENKKDLPSSRVKGGGDGDAATMVPQDVLEKIAPAGTPVREVATCGIVEDAALEEGVEWLLAAVSERYESLAARVETDTAHVKEEKERKRQERLAALRNE